MIKNVNDLKVVNFAGNYYVSIKNCGGKTQRIDPRFAVYVGANRIYTEDQVITEFFRLLKENKLVNKKGVRLKQDENGKYYLDKTNSLPPRTTIHKQNDPGKLTVGFMGDIGKYFYITYYKNQFPKEMSDLDMVWEIRKSLGTNTPYLGTKGQCLLEYETDHYAVIPKIDFPTSQRVPLGMKVTGFSSSRLTVDLNCGENNYKKVIFDISKYPPQLNKRIYLWYLLEDILKKKAVSVNNEKILYDDIKECFYVVSQELPKTEIVEKIDTPTKKSNTIANPEEAKVLIDKEVIGSNSWVFGNIVFRGILVAIDDSRPDPFQIYDKENQLTSHVTFIQQAPEKVYVPFNLSDYEIRKSLYGEIIRSVDGTDIDEFMITSFSRKNDVWYVKGNLSSYNLVKSYVFADTGKPCGMLKG